VTAGLRLCERGRHGAHAAFALAVPGERPPVVGLVVLGATWGRTLPPVFVVLPAAFLFLAINP
jgi:hypothetical protein